LANGASSIPAFILPIKGYLEEIFLFILFDKWVKNQIIRSGQHDTMIAKNSPKNDLLDR
jgi:hypothetical protein